MSEEREDDNLLGSTVAERFRCDTLLGVGGMGRVYKATQLSVNRPIALKVLRAEIGDAKAAQDRFMREAQTVASIAHPAVVQLVDFGRDPDRDLLYLAMEFVEGVPLSDVMKLGRIRSAALSIARQIAGALAQAHRAGVIHRDLKPDNVMLVATAEGALGVKVLDFGIALPQSDETRLTRTGAIVGTPHYMSPEQAQDLPLTASSDLYSLGVILYEMLAGQLPFVADTPLALLFKHVQAPPPELGSVAPGVEPEVADLVSELLAKTPEARPDTASEVVARLTELEGRARWQPAMLEVGATNPRAFLPLVDVQRATSETDDVFGATVDSSPVALQTPEEVVGGSHDTSPDLAPSTGNAGSIRSPNAPETEPPRAAERADEQLVSTSQLDGPPRSILLIILSVIVAGIVALAWMVVDRFPTAPVGNAVEHVDKASGTSADTDVGQTLTSERAQTRIVARDLADTVARVAVVAAGSGGDDPEQPRPKNAPSQTAPPAGAAEDEPPADAVTAIGPRADDVTIPSVAKAKKSGNARPPRIPPPTDSDTLQRRKRVAGGTCVGDNRCQFDGLERPGSAVCQDDSTCVARCPIGGCLQFCQDRATCWFSCEGGKCQRMVDPDAKMTEFSD